MQRLTLLQPIDLLIGPLALAILIVLGGLLYQGETRKLGVRFTSLFWWAFAARLGASLLRIAITDYLVPSWGVDTITYFRLSGTIVSLFSTDPFLAGEILFQSYEDYSLEAQEVTTHYFWEKLRTSIIVRIGAVLYFFTNGSYLATAWLCTFLAFIGSWLTYKTFYRYYPQYGLLIGLAVLFLPTVTFYSTNLFKDPFCILGLGLLCNGTFLVRERGHAIMPWLGIIIGVLLLGIIKIYILFAFLLAYGVFWFAALDLPLRKGILKRFAKSGIIIGGIILLVGGVYLFLNIGLSRYNVPSILKRLDYLLTGLRGQDTGSGYALPIISITPGGILLFLVSAFNVSIFRPYPWEVNGLGPLILFLESFPTLLLTAYLLVRTAFVNLFLQIFKDPVLLFCFTFSGVFLTITGAFSPTFGALCRYKIPGFPFFVIVLVVTAARYFEAERIQEAAGRPPTT